MRVWGTRVGVFGKPFRAPRRSPIDKEGSKRGCITQAKDYRISEERGRMHV